MANDNDDETQDAGLDADQGHRREPSRVIQFGKATGSWWFLNAAPTFLEKVRLARNFGWARAGKWMLLRRGGLLAPCFLFFAAFVAAPMAPAAAADSVYSTLDLQDGCTVLDSAAPDEGGEWIARRCPGLKGYFVFVTEGDLRTSLDYGAAGLLRRWQSFSDFNGVGDTIEWRRASDGRDMKPFATIHRWFVSYGQADRTDTQQILVVSTVAAVAGERSCMVGLIDATSNPEANHLARQVADDQARGFRCGHDRPRYYGEHTHEPPLP